MSRSFSSQIANENNTTSADIVDAQKTFQARQKLAKIFRSKSTSDISNTEGEFFDVFVKNGNLKRGWWSSPKSIYFYPSSWYATLTASNRKVMCAAV